MFSAAKLSELMDALDAVAGEVGADVARGRGERRARGAFFTPAPLVSFVVDQVVERLFERRAITWADDGAPELRLLDPAAGDGRFVRRLAEALADRSPRTEIEREARIAATLARAVAVERDPDFAALAAANLGGAEVICAEALCDAGDLGSFDLIASNPPYLRSIHLGAADEALRERLRGRYKATSYGEWDLYAAFIEQSLGWLAPGGVAGLVVPSRWMTARFARELRAELGRRGAVAGLVDFDSRQVFAGATTYCSVVFLGAGGSGTTAARTVDVARLRGARWSSGRVDRAELGAAPWRLSVGRGRAVLDRLAGAGPRLGDRARIAKGAGTNADAAYVLTSAPRPDDPEPALLRPLLRGRDVVAWGAAGEHVRCLIPYRADGTLLEPGELGAYPKAAAHLLKYRRRLEARERGRFAGERYYQFGRPQNMALLLGDRRRVVVPDVFREPRALIDDGAFVLDSAYVVVPDDPELCALIAAVLNSPAVYLFLRETGVPLRGGYRRMKTAYLRELPLPDPDSAAASSIVAAVAAGAPAADISEHVRCAYGIDRADWVIE